MTSRRQTADLDLVTVYLRDIARHDLLDARAEADLGKQLLEGRAAIAALTNPDEFDGGVLQLAAGHVDAMLRLPTWTPAQRCALAFVHRALKPLRRPAGGVGAGAPQARPNASELFTVLAARTRAVATSVLPGRLQVELRAAASLLDAEGAKVRLAQANLRLVVAIAGRQRGPRALLERISDGNVALWTAVQRWDPRLGARFSTYACPLIRHAVLRGFEEHRAIRLPASVVADVRHLRRTEVDLVQQLGRSASNGELAGRLGSDEALIVPLRAIAEQKVVSLSAPGFEDEVAEPLEASVADTSVAEVFAALERVELRETLDAFLTEELGPHAARVVWLRFGLADGESRTQAEIADQFGVSPQRVAQIIAAALDKLTHPARVQRLQAALGAV